MPNIKLHFDFDVEERESKRVPNIKLHFDFDVEERESKRVPNIKLHFDFDVEERESKRVPNIKLHFDFDVEESFHTFHVMLCLMIILIFIANMHATLAYDDISQHKLW